ncbi:MAG: transcriptional repressor [Clostridia bacterium]|nr:transcriptional repressor [Clostridia bacterium]
MDINKILAGAGLKCTAQRRQVIDILNKADAPLTAENIYEKSSDISLSTVYRIAEKLVEKGIVTKNTIRDSDKFYYELADNKHRHYAICLGCGDMKYVDICPVHDLKIDDFTVTGHKLEIYGYCDECAGRAAV